MQLALGPGPVPRLKRGATVWVGYSGGLDSTVLLHLLAATPRRLRAVHVDHGLQQASAKWAAHCRAVCRKLGVPLEVVRVSVDGAHPDGPEGAARAVRYAAFESVMKDGDWLATAHHRDDQAETVLLRLLRGAGPEGLAGMKQARPFGTGYLWRPLLAHARDALRDYAGQHGLSWVEDPHNDSERFDRGYLRTRVLPGIGRRWPQAAAMLARSAAHCSQATQLLDDLARQDLAAVGAAGVNDCLSVRRVLRLDPARRNNLLRCWARDAGCDVPTFDVLQRLEKEVLRARPDASPRLAWGGSELRRYRDGLYIMARLPEPPGPVVLDWDGRKDLELPPGCGRLQVRRPPRGNIALQVRFPQGGERIKPDGSRHTRTLRNLFQEEGVPGWVRERSPLIYFEGSLSAVADRWIDAELGRARRRGFRYRWRHEMTGDPAF